MAKKSKKKVSSLVKLAPLALLVLAVVVIAMGFVTGLIYKPENGDPSTVSLFKATFGGKIDNISFSIGSLVSSTTSIQFSFALFLAIFLPIIGGIIALLIKGVIGGGLAFVCFLASAILFFLAPQLASIKSVTTSVIGGGSKVYTFKDLGYSLGVGSILAAVFSILGAVVSLCYTGALVLKRK